MIELVKGLSKQIIDARWQFEMCIEAACLEITDIAKQISPAIGEISVEEAKRAILNEFIKRIEI